MAENYIYVKAHPKMGEQVGLWETNDRHPKNPAGEREVFVAGQEQEPQQVAQTAKVLEALRQERLIQVTKGGGEAKNPIATPPGGETTNPLAPDANAPENPETTPASGQG